MKSDHHDKQQNTPKQWELWTLALQREYRDVCSQYGVRLSMPVLLIGDRASSWGHWDAWARCILISSQLIERYDWDVVVSVLKHEMAHQIVSDIFQVEDGHGVHFKKACNLLGLEERYQTARLSQDMPFVSWKEERTDTEEQSLLKKIEKLLSLGQSSNEHEAALAMQKVQELYAKYNFHQFKAGKKQEFENLCIETKKTRLSSLSTFIASLLQEYFFVNVIICERYEPKDDKAYKVFRLFGARQNLLMAEYVFFFLQDRLQSLWTAYARDKSLGARYKNSYQHGILKGFHQKLHDNERTQHKKMAQEVGDLRPLIARNDAALEAYCKFFVPRIVRSTQKSSSRLYTEHFDNGRQDGQRLNINKPIHDQQKSSQRQLG